MPHVNHDGNRGRGSHSNGGSEDFTFYNLGWENVYDATGVPQYKDIDETTDSVSIWVRDQDHYHPDQPETGHDGNDSIVFTIDDPNYSKGFAQEVYIFTEEEAKNNGGQIQKDIPLVAGSDIKAVTIIIEDNDPGEEYNLNPIQGTKGANTLDGTAIGDAIYGYGGDDILDGKAGRDSIYGFAGNDTLKGGDDNDVVYGHSGNDSLEGNQGNDVLDGGTGNDTLNGGSGVDQLFGWYGDDTIIGGFGSDTLYGEDGNDYLYGDENTGIVVSGGNDKLYGGNGDDTLNGGKGNDELYGEDGNDKLIGQSGSDILSGGSGNDILTGGSGSDTLTGGEGQDKFVFNTDPDGVDTITDFDVTQGDIIQINLDSFRSASLDQFIYSQNSGSLYFDADLSNPSNFYIKLAILENRPTGFSTDNISFVATIN